MKKNFALSLVVISLLTFVLGVAASKPPETKKVSLIHVRYASNNSLIVSFNLTGFHTLSEVQGSVIVDERFTQLTCKAVKVGAKGIRVIRCLAERMNRHASQPARIWLSGFVFYTKIPPKK